MSGRGHALSTGEFTDYLPNYKCRQTRSEFAHKNYNGTIIGGSLGPTVFYDKARTGKAEGGTFNTNESLTTALDMNFSVGHVSEENSVETASTTFSVDAFAGTVVGGDLKFSNNNIATGGKVELKHKDLFATSYAGTSLSGTSSIFATNKNYFAPNADENGQRNDFSHLQNQYSATQAGATLGLDLYALGPRLGASVDVGAMYEHNVSNADGERQVYDGYGLKFNGGIRWDIPFKEGFNGGMQLEAKGGFDAPLDFTNSDVNKNFGKNITPHAEATIRFRF